MKLILKSSGSEEESENEIAGNDNEATNSEDLESDPEWSIDREFEHNLGERAARRRNVVQRFGGFHRIRINGDQYSGSDSEDSLFVPPSLSSDSEVSYGSNNDSPTAAERGTSWEGPAL